MRFRFLTPLLLVSGSLLAQTYSPKVIHFDGVKSYAQGDLLAVAQLKAGSPLTTADIDAGLQRLADTGLFAESKYTVSPAELKISLVPIAASATLPVRYGNFVWWGPGELTPLVHARVPLFNGVLPLNGTLQDDVKKALQALLAEKGIASASVEMRSSTDTPGGPITALTYTVLDPQIRIGTIHFDGASPEAAPQLAKLQVKLAEDDYDEVETPNAVINDTEQIYRDDGFLDIAVSTPVRSAPRKVDSGRWVVDLAASVKGGELYRVADVVVHAAPPVSADELGRVLTVKAGSPASAGEFRSARPQLQSIWFFRRTWQPAFGQARRSTNFAFWQTSSFLPSAEQATAPGTPHGSFKRFDRLVAIDEEARAGAGLRRAALGAAAVAVDGPRAVLADQALGVIRRTNGRTRRTAGIADGLHAGVAVDGVTLDRADLGAAALALHLEFPVRTFDHFLLSTVHAADELSCVRQGSPSLATESSHRIFLLASWKQPCGPRHGSSVRTLFTQTSAVVAPTRRTRRLPRFAFPARLRLAALAHDAEQRRHHRHHCHPDSTLDPCDLSVPEPRMSAPSFVGELDPRSTHLLTTSGARAGRSARFWTIRPRVAWRRRRSGRGPSVPGLASRPSRAPSAC